MRFPMFGGLWPIRPRDELRDAFAGLTLASMNIPQVLGYTRIAGTPVVTGLYTVLLPLVAFALFGSSRHLVVAADSATAMAFKPARRQFERVTLSSVIATPDRRSRFRLDLAGQTELRQFGADLAKSRAPDRCRRRQATVLALCGSAHHRKLSVGKFDTHDPTLPLILEVRAIRPPHQDEPRIGRSRRGGWVTRARRAVGAKGLAHNALRRGTSCTHARFRTESQSFLRRR
jgi:Sulfate permease family